MDNEDDHARRILESITEAFYSLDREFRFAYLNRTAARLLGRDDLVGKVVWDEFPAARGTRVEDAYERAMNGERVEFVEYYPAPLDSWYEVRAYPSPEGVSVYFQDITERRNAEAAHRRSRNQLELVVRAANIGVWYCPLPFDVLIWDDKVKEHFHLPPDAAVTIDMFYERLHPDDREPTRAAIARSVDEKSHYTIEYRTVSPDGKSTKWIHALGRTFYDADGKPMQFDGVTLDISDRKRIERERERMIEAERAARTEAERQSRVKDDFLAMLSHELRTPLNAVFGWSQLLLGRVEAGSEIHRGLETIARNARAQAKIVDDLIDMSSMLSGKLRLVERGVDVAQLVVSARETSLPDAEAKGIVLTADVTQIHGVQVRGDAARLQQVLANLVSNAIKFTSSGGHVWLSAEQKLERVVIHVRDDGAGIAADFLPFVFDRFRQADGSITRKHGGLGLGLSIVKQLVEAHGGTLIAESAGIGSGSHFEVSLPRGGSASGDADEAAPPSSIGGSDLRDVRVLVVDDEPDARELVGRLLRERGAVITDVGSSADAIALFKAGAEFDILISDIGMPGGDGYELLRQVRALSGRARELPAIALTAFARPEDRVRTIAAGYLLHIRKPVDTAELIALVAAAVGR